MRALLVLLLASICAGCDLWRDEPSDNRVGLTLSVPNAFRVSATFEDEDLTVSARTRGLLCTGGVALSVAGDNGEDEIDVTVQLDLPGVYPEPGTYTLTEGDDFTARTTYTGTRLPGFDDRETTLYDGTDATLTVTESGERFAGTLELVSVGGDVTAEIDATFSTPARRTGC